jgi:hypothetical protein
MRVKEKRREGKKDMSTEPTPVKLTDLTDEVLAEAETHVLRSWAMEFLADYNRETVVATVTLTDAVVSTNGVMTNIDVMFGSLTGAYRKAGLDPQRKVQYNELKMVVWQDDPSLRSSLRYARERAIKKAEEEA